MAIRRQRSEADAQEHVVFRQIEVDQTQSERLRKGLAYQRSMQPRPRVIAIASRFQSQLMLRARELYLMGPTVVPQ